MGRRRDLDRGEARAARRRRDPCDGVGRIRIQLEPADRGLPRRPVGIRHPQGRPAAHRGTRLPRPADRPPALCLERPQVGPRHRIHDGGPPRFLGGARLPQHRRPLGRAALLLPGGTGRRARDLGRVLEVPPAPRGLARTLAALSESSE
ncbi:hypothetical protein SBRY_20852 [Actinacidiphila bryophytorum]|uniref:Uncharacterized protein n=1 Tax=Actinacidiphila bryophytorum TaxID=1436133 RepID=A0A9W4GZU4_9ACTN|nr:hypothetical protein SBRY_20852 [Actinacidiphila bryophytorum]